MSDLQKFGWKGDASVEDWLLEQPWDFEFFQAIKLLELLHPDRRPPGESPDPDSEVVRLRSCVTLAYPASEVQHIDPPEFKDEPFTMDLNLLGLAGQYGPLPLADTERILDRVRRRDEAMRDFLDIFHHRLLSLLVIIRKQNQPSYTVLEPQHSRAAFYLYSFFGLGHTGLRNRLAIPDRALLFYCGILAQHPRSASGLERFFTDFFNIPTHVTQLSGGWRYLEEEQWTAIGHSGNNQILGQTSMLGRRYWDQQGSFLIDLGPLAFDRFSDFLPIGTAFQSLCELSRFFAGPEVEFAFRLTVLANHVAESRLDSKGITRLGWTSWLKTKPFQSNDSQVILRGYSFKLN